MKTMEESTDIRYGNINLMNDKYKKYKERNYSRRFKVRKNGDDVNQPKYNCQSCGKKSPKQYCRNCYEKLQITQMGWINYKGDENYSSQVMDITKIPIPSINNVPQKRVEKHRYLRYQPENKHVKTRIDRLSKKTHIEGDKKEYESKRKTPIKREKEIILSTGEMIKKCNCNYCEESCECKGGLYSMCLCECNDTHETMNKRKNMLNCKTQKVHDRNIENSIIHTEVMKKLEEIYPINTTLKRLIKSIKQTTKIVKNSQKGL